MGRGDKRTKKGKIFAGSHGNSRLRKKNPAFVMTPKILAEKAAKAAALAKAVSAKTDSPKGDSPKGDPIKTVITKAAKVVPKKTAPTEPVSA